MSESQIVTFFTDKSVFLTGSTGFLGKLLLEKLLKVCGVRMVYVLVRQKKGKAEADRYKEIFDTPVFEQLKQECPDYLAKVQMITGDCALENVGVSEENWKILHEEVNVVIHCAATVRFDQALRTAYNINVRATRDLLLAAKRMKHLQSFIHVSTAYANCPRTDIEEIIYKAPMTDQQLDMYLNSIESDEMVARMTPSLLGKWPNTYTFTKCVSEEMIVRISEDDAANLLPVAIVRPSMIISTYKDPFPGWIDNFYGPLAVCAGVAAGVLRSFKAVPEVDMDMVPADYVVNTILATAWVTSLRSDMQVEVYNYCCSREQRLCCKKMFELSKEAQRKIPLMNSIWAVSCTINRWDWKHKMDSFLFHTVPSHIVDFICKLLGKPQRMVDIYKKIDNAVTLTTYFRMREWNFSNDKMTALWERFNEEDKKRFEIRIHTFDWSDFMYDFLLGGRVYLLKDPISTIPQALKRRRNLIIAKWTLSSVLVLLLAYFFYFVYLIFFA